MNKLFKWFIFGHIHKFEQVQALDLKSEGRTVGKVYILRCDKCGEMKTFEVYI
jgi:hypothetical protein